jgi:hypothetical protein
MLNDFCLLCLTESELLQWYARGSIHLSSSRILHAGVDKAPLFSLSPFVKLDDAKARVLIRLDSNLRIDEFSHPYFIDSNVLSLPWEVAKSLCPVLPQFRRRLEDFNLAIEEWDISSFWEEWLLKQGCHERLEALLRILKKTGFNDHIFLANKPLLKSIIYNVVRPQSDAALSMDLPYGWRKLIQNRDSILKKLRFDGHSDRKSFLAASIAEICTLNKIKPIKLNLIESSENIESGWSFHDLTSSVLESIHKSDDKGSIDMSEGISLLIGAAYLRLYDELHYGAKDMTLCINLLRFMKYSINSIDTDILTVAVLGSFPSDTLRSLDFPKIFYNF